MRTGADRPTGAGDDPVVVGDEPRDRVGDEPRDRVGDEPRDRVGDEPRGGVVGTVRATALRGDRPYVVAFLAALGLAVVIVSGPVRTWAEQRDLVDSRRDVLAAIEEENELLGARVDDLEDPATIEAEAREELGMYRPGEVPFVVIPPEVDQPQLRSLPVPEDEEPPSFLERIRQALSDIFG